MAEYSKPFPSREEQRMAALTREKEGLEARLKGADGAEAKRLSANLESVNQQLSAAAKDAKAPSKRAETREVGQVSGSGTEQSKIRRVVVDEASEAAHESGLGPATEALAKETAGVPGTAPEPEQGLAGASNETGANRVPDKGETAERIPGTDTVKHSKSKPAAEKAAEASK